MLAGFRNVLRPAAFHGHGRRPPFFEGWYYKIVDASAQQAMAIIPGVYRARDPSESHAFIQVFDGAGRRAWYERFDVDVFWAHPREFEVRIAGNRFSRDALSLNLHTESLHLHGELSLGEGFEWPVSPLSPGVMGPFAWIPFLECYHGVLSFDHALRGSLSLQDRELKFDGGRGYIEKDWGSSFPASWVWTQCNHFEEAGVSVSASIAEIPNLGRSFPGFIVGAHIGGELYAFTTHNLSRVEELRRNEEEVHWTLRNRRHRLKLVVTRAPTTLLPGPTINGMNRDVHETLHARMRVELTRLSDGQQIYSGEGGCAGLEVQGDVEQLARVCRPPKR